jgi:hypothetical protein
MWTYQQKTGRLSHDGAFIADGYSGFGAGKNNPDMQSVPNVGPTPRGEYTIGPVFDSPDHGPHAMRLSPAAGTATFDRDGFLLHGDSRVRPGSASHGCLIFPLQIRQQISQSNDKDLQVV